MKNKTGNNIRTKLTILGVVAAAFCVFTFLHDVHAVDFGATIPTKNFDVAPMNFDVKMSDFSILLSPR